VETAVAWQAAIEYAKGPTALVLTRQNLPHQTRTAEQLGNIARGAYVLKDGTGKPQVILIATGSEVALAMAAAEQLQAAGKQVRVVSMPSTDVFDAQDAAYREAVLPNAVRARVAIEAAHADYWRRYVGLDGEVIGMTTFGASAPIADLMKLFGFTVDNVVAAAERVMGQA
jgi:transketolase